MQLCALNSEKKVVFANQASKHTDYFCLECHTIVRLRGGLHRQNHFYHLDPSRQCRQNGKSMEHLQVQKYIFNSLPEADSRLEFPFPSINRIADVVWLSEKIIFEIQCSPITALEVEARNRDYAREGFQVVWILHDKRFNQNRLTAAELFLQDRPHYFTDIDIEGDGNIYDQFAIYHLGRRHVLLPALNIDIARPYRSKAAAAQLSLASKRQELWPVYFSGDLVDICLQNKIREYVDEASNAEAEFERFLAGDELTWCESVLDWAYFLIVRPYKLIFQILLERACR